MISGWWMVNLTYTLNKKMKIKSFTELKVWQRAHQLTLKIYKITKQFPVEEKYGITSQLRRATTSITINIVEGFYRHSTKELINFLYISRGSCGECLYCLLLTKDLGLLNVKKYNEIKIEYEIIIKQLNAWIKSLKNR